MQAKYPKETGLLSNVIGGVATWLISGDTSTEKNAIKKQIGKLDEPAYYLEKLNQIETEKQGIECTKAYLSLMEEIHDIYLMQQELQWFNIEALKLAYDDM